MIKRNIKRPKNNVGLHLRPIRDYRWLVLIVLGLITIFLPFLSTHAAREGDGRIIYGDGTSTDPKVRTWQSGPLTLSAEASLPTAGATVKATIVEAAPTRDEMIAGVVNSSNLLTIYRWNGSNWSSQWTVTLPATHTPSFDIAYEQISGKVMVVYSTNTAATNELARRTFDGSSWTAATSLDSIRTSGTVHAVVASSRPGTNEIAIAWGDSNLDLSANYWSGTDWQGEPTSTFETNLARFDQLDATIQTAVFDLEFESQGGELLMVWAKEGEQGFRRMTRSVGSDGEWRDMFVTTIGSYEPKSFSLSAHPNSDYIAVSLNGHFTLDSVVTWREFAGVWEGSSWQMNSAVTAMDASAYGRRAHDAAWVETNGEVRAVFAFDIVTGELAYRTYNKNTDAFSSATTRTLYSDSQTQIKVVANPHNPSELVILSVGTDNRLIAERLLFDDTTLTYIGLDSSATAIVEPTVTSQSTMTGWAIGYAYDQYIPVAALPAATALDATLFFDASTSTYATNRPLTLATNTWGTAGQISTQVLRKEFMEVKASPVRNEKIGVFVASDGDMEVYRWNGSYWHQEWLYPLGSGKTPRFAIAYEQVSGRAMVIFSRNIGTTNELAYRIWDGSSWSTISAYDALRTSGIVSYIVAKPRPGTNEIAVAWADNNMDLSANYWANSAWAGERSSVLETKLGGLSDTPTEIESPIVDLAFEGTSGELLIAWGHDTYLTTDSLVNNTLRRVTRTAGAAGTWSSVTQSTLNNHVRDIKLVSDPSSDYISAIFHSNKRADGTNDNDFVRIGYWTGSAWSFHGTGMGSSIMTAGESDVTTVWLTASGTSIALYVFDRPDASTTGIHYTWYNRTTNAWIYDTVGGLYRNSSSPVPTFGKRQIKLVNDPADTSKATIILVDDNNDLFVKRLGFDGTSVTFTSVEDGGVVMTDSISATTSLGWKSDFVYQNNTPTPSVLGVDIVNASGESVAAPSVTMTGVVTGTSCQTATGTFGTNGQRIRVQNTTVTPGWTVSVAPTSGSTSNWSSGTATYDFNDASGSPAGCGDGGDADTIAGRLSVDPAAGTLSAISGCATTGVSKGTSSSFAEGSVNSITLMNAASNAQTNCYWDLVGVGLTQTVPAMQAAGRYTVNMTLTTVAN